ncbi:MAG: bifunctional DNA primase/polymerase [Vicinamibacterales bacterium]
MTTAVTPAEWFWLHGIHVFPTVNKVPAVRKGTSQFEYRCTRAQAAGFREYGVPLGPREGYADGLAVVDADRTPTKAWAVANLPRTPFTVTTGPCHDGSTDRGLHSYFRTPGPLPPSIRRDGLSFENRNRGQYVVGPGSIRPDGVVYRASEWSWRWEDIPCFPEPFLFDDGSCGRFSPERTTVGVPGEEYEFPDAVSHGDRHRELFRLLRSFKGSGIDRASTREVVHLANANRCHPPLDEDDAFEDWFTRAWNNRDRPFPSRDPFAVDLEAL